MSEAALPTTSRGARRGLISSPRAWGGALLIALAAAAGVVWWLVTRPEPRANSFQEGLTALRADDLPTARRCLQELSKAPENASCARLLRAALLLKRGYFVPALNELEHLHEEPELKFQALLLSGEAWHRIGRHVEAQAALQDALKIDRDAVDAHRWLGASYYDLGAIHQAVYHLKRTADLDPADQRPLRLLGLIHKDYERFEEAIDFYSQSLSRKSDQPDWIQVRLELATCQVKLRRHREALQTLGPCPNSVAVIVLRADCQYAVGETESAKALVRRALELDPQHLEGLVLLGTILLEQRDLPGAIDALKQAATSAPQDYTARFKLAQAYTQANQPELAAAEQKVADRIRDVRKVFAELHEAAWNNPEDARVRLRLAQLAQELGRPDLAEVWIKSAAALQPVSKALPYEE